jgi:hypothetical protein
MEGYNHSFKEIMAIVDCLAQPGRSLLTRPLSGSMCPSVLRLDDELVSVLVVWNLRPESPQMRIAPKSAGWIEAITEASNHSFKEVMAIV